MPGVIVVGTQWGDEGKGKVIDLLTANADHIVRAQGGNNAGHTIIIDDQEYRLHLIPSGILHETPLCYIGSGTVIDPEVLLFEIKALRERGIQIDGRLFISHAAHVIFPYHRILDRLMERTKGKGSVGTTGRGIGPCYADKANRIGLRVGDLVDRERFPLLLREALRAKNEELVKIYNEKPLIYEDILQQYQYYGEQIKPFMENVEEKVNMALERKENVLFEGAQGTFLDLTSGTYPFVTSSSTLAGGICVGSGVGPSRIDHTLGVVKAYTTRVGNGPLPTEVKEDEQFINHQTARELGTTTRRKRRIGWFDAVLIKTAVRLNGLNSLALTKLDILDNVDSIKICVGYTIEGKQCDHFPSNPETYDKIEPIYEALPGWKCDTSAVKQLEDLPENAKFYLKRIEELVGVPFSLISLGPERNSTILLKELFSSKEEGS